jgi:hypothetical protein
VRTYGNRTEATDYQATAGLEQLSAQQAQTAGLIGTTTTLAAGAESIASKWAALQTKGAAPVF